MSGVAHGMFNEFGGKLRLLNLDTGRSNGTPHRLAIHFTHQHRLTARRNWRGDIDRAAEGRVIRECASTRPKAT